MTVLDRAKVAATKLTSRFQTERWWNGISIDPTHDNQVGLYIHCKYPPPKFVIPSTFEGFRIIQVIESTILNNKE